MFEKIRFCNTMFSQFFVALASQNGSKIQIFSNFFEKFDLVKTLTKHWLCAEKSRFRLLKIVKKSIQQRARQGHREKPPKNRFLLPFGPPKTSQNRTKTSLGREQMGARTKLVSRRYGTRAQVVGNQRDPAFVKRPKGYAYD